MDGIELIDTTDYLSPRLEALTHALEVVQNGFNSVPMRDPAKEAYARTEAVILDVLQAVIRRAYPPGDVVPEDTPEKDPACSVCRDDGFYYKLAEDGVSLIKYVCP